MSHLDEKTIIIRNLRYSRALLLKMRLELAHIPCFLSNTQQADTGVDLSFPEHYSLEAMQLLQPFMQASGIEKEAMVKHLRRVRRILVPVDFSEHSIQAAHYALDLARVLKARIRLLNVWFNNLSDGFVYNEMFAFQVNIDEILKEQEAEATRKIKDIAQQLKNRIRAEKIRGVTVEYDLVRGHTVDGILDIADSYQPGLIVMGTQGTSREGPGFLGSNTAKLIEHSPVPVLSVPAAFNAMNFFKPHSIAFITRFDTTDIHALHQLIAFVKPFDVKIYCVHLQAIEGEVLEKVWMQQIKDHFKEVQSGQEIECIMIDTDDQVSSIEAFVQEKRIDMLAITHRKRNLLTQFFRPSLTKKLLFQTETPILIYRNELC
ncbi:MAG: universal stress protein [Bacteroidales bacterium]|jgi:nucleotide-binding universal stress UspA family protein|nr:universal stress protein [Bacteroidales bacterium]MDD3701013.1 universal stress protein [Bacteroidales bacterium]MDY0370255.1 universal stress protein [Bacteroidales bacterium]